MDQLSRILTPNQSLYDSDIENPLRPRKLSDYIGQHKVKKNLEVFIEAAKKRNDTLDHVLLYGPPGLGKTTLAMIIANEMNVNIKITSGPAIERPGDLASMLTNLQPESVFFIDEIHRMPCKVEEILYPAMEDFSIDIVSGKGNGASSYHLPLPKFTLIGATTRAGNLGSPLRDRFGVILHLDLYSPQDLEKIILRSAKILGVGISSGGALEIAKRSRGTPRIANRLLRRVRDFANFESSNEISKEVADRSLKSLEIDEYGLDSNDRKLLYSVVKNYNGGPVGLEALASILGEDSSTIEDVYEPYLIQMGFINRTSRGRVVTPAAFEYVKSLNSNKI